MQIIQTLKNIYHKLPDPPSTNYHFRTINPSPYEILPKKATILDIGSKGRRAVLFIW